jgi:hypothetical protein
MMKKTICIGIVGMFLLTGLASMSVIGMRSLSTPTEELTVHLIADKPLTTATITATGPSGIPYSVQWDGEFYSTSLPVDSNPDVITEYTVTVEVDGYFSPDPQTAFMSLGHPQQLFFTLEKHGYGSISVYVFYGIAGAITITDADVSMQLLENGNPLGEIIELPYCEDSWDYWLDNVAAGDYRVTVMHDDFWPKPHVQDAHVEAGEETMLLAQLGRFKSKSVHMMLQRILDPFPILRLLLKL